VLLLSLPSVTEVVLPTVVFAALLVVYGGIEWLEKRRAGRRL
jgi:hypothetical protein